MPNQSGRVVLVLVLILLALGGAVYSFSTSFKDQKGSDQMPDSLMLPSEGSEAVDIKVKSQDYNSKNLKISFKIPQDADVEEKFTRIRINSNGGRIDINFNGTNFENAAEYYQDLKQKNNLSPLSYEKGNINQYDYILTRDEAEDLQKETRTYLIYADYGIYIFSTSDEALYPVLDQVVQSFEYRP